jgi:adenylate cyclase
LFPAVTIMATFLLATLLRRLQTERAERFVRRAFSSYVSPNLVKHLIEHPDALKLGGERRECSFVTTDLAGFTGLVERSEPAQVVALLNEYLEQMTAIAFRHEGTIDKIVGDAVAVLFGAPTPQPDHARRAVACALEMDAFARTFAAAKRQGGMPLGRTRIGVNSGTVIVGNVGGGGMFDYRALGDMINTASRLETANRTLGTRICVAAATAAQVPGLSGRPVGRLLLKGKSEPIEVLNALHADEDQAPNVLAYRAAFALLERDDPAALDGFAQAAAAHPDDALIAYQLARLKAGERGASIVLADK